MIDRKKNWLVLTIFCGSFILSGLAYVAFTNYYIARDLLLQFNPIYNTYTTAPRLQYVTVQSVDVDNHSLVLVAGNAYAASGDDHVLRVIVSDHPYIARQYVTGTGDTYDSLSALTPATLQDIRPGDRAAVFIRGDKTKLIADIILFGNPL